MANDPDEYFLGYRRAEQERLRAQALQLADEARWLFDQRRSSKSAVDQVAALKFLARASGHPEA
jgi:hypothetical protein